MSAEPRRLQEFADSLVQAVFEMDLRGRLTFANRRCFEAFGYSREDFDRGLDALAMVVSEDRPRVDARARRLLAGEVLGPEEYTARRKDGSTFPALIFSSAFEENGAPAGIRGIIVDITTFKQVEEALRLKEEKERLILDHVDEIVYSIRMEAENPALSAPDFVSARVEAITGFPPETYLREPSLWFRLIHADDLPALQQATDRILRSRVPGVREYRLRRREGDYIWIEDRIVPQVDGSGRLRGYFGVARDVTERKRLEEQLLTSQKLEAIGRLAGGVAHDLNNILTAITGYCELLRQNKRPELAQRNVTGIRQAADRAAALTRQLLAFGRRQVLTPRVLELSSLVDGLGDMLRRLIGEDVSLTIAAPEGRGRVRADQAQLEQVVLNLVVNARDAMPAGGELRIGVAAVEVEAHAARPHPGLVPGSYVRLSVSDTGVGMDAETRRRVFEPFFTTKELGKGTGLGLSTVYGIVEQSGGYVAVESEPGRGTTFDVYLPRAAEPAEAPAPPEPPASATGRETILLVEDEEMVRAVTREMLELQGYRVLAAADAEEALALAGREEGPVHLLLTDVVMPGLSGDGLADRLRQARPQLRVILMSGHAADAVGQGGVSMPDAFLQKPFNADELGRRLRSVLERSGWA